MRDSAFDFDAVWRSQAAREERRAIANRECACPLANAAYTSILVNPRALLAVGRNLLRRPARTPAAKPLPAAAGGGKSPGGGGS